MKDDEMERPVIRLIDLVSAQNSVRFMCCPERNIDNVLLPDRGGSDCVARFIRGSRCGTAREFFQEWAAALQFPYYAQPNWASFDECLCDLEWLQVRHCVIMITHCDRLLLDEPETLKYFAAIVRTLLSGDLMACYGVGPYDDVVLTHFVFHAEQSQREIALERLRAVGLDPPVIECQ